MTDDWISDLARHAEAIPPNQRTWSAADEHGNAPGAVPAWCVSPVDAQGKWLGDVAYIPQGLDNEEALAEFIAAANPATILRLINEVRGAVTDNEHLRADLLRVNAEYHWLLSDVEAERDRLAARLAAVEAWAEADQ